MHNFVNTLNSLCTGLCHTAVIAGAGMAVRAAISATMRIVAQPDRSGGVGAAPDGEELMRGETRAGIGGWRAQIPWEFWLILALALTVRLVLLGRLPRDGWISDEGEYYSAAVWLAEGRGMAWYLHYLWTRVPFYPMLLAAHVRLFDSDLAAISISQSLLGVVNVALTYGIAWRMAAARQRLVAGVAAGLSAVYWPLVLYAQLLLTETVFLTLILGAVWLVSHVAPGRRGWLVLVLAGGLLGLATLTRSLAAGWVPLVAVWLWWHAGWSWRGAMRGLVLLAGCAALILPWSIVASRTYGGVVVLDTSGAFNLLLGAWTAHDGVRRDAPTRNFVLGLFDPAVRPAATCAPYPGPVPNQAARQAAMSAEAWCLIRDDPAAFVAKSGGELVDLFRINYTGAERLTGGFTTGRLPPWFVVATLVLDDMLYALVAVLAVPGWLVLARARRPLAWLVLAWLGYTIAVAPLLFAINRFRVPLMPFACILAAVTLVAPRAAWQQLRQRWGGALAGLLSLALLLVITTPDTYLRPAGQSSPSLLGPYPSSLAASTMALAARERFLVSQAFGDALVAGDLARARQLSAGPLTSELERLAPALLALHAGQPAAALAALPAADAIAARQDALASVVRGAALRQQGDLAAARAAFTPRFVDDANPVAWAWRALPALPTRAIDLGGNLDLGLIRGCHLGEGDPAAGGTFRWCDDGAQLRFADAGGAGRITLRADARGWAGYRAAPVPISVWLGGQLVGTFSVPLDAPVERSLPLPPTARGSTLVFTIRGPVLIPDARRYLSQQGEQVGQLHAMTLRLDWVALDGAQP